MRLGKFYLDAVSVVENPDNYAITLSVIRFVPLQVNLVPSLDLFELIGISEFFDELSEHELETWDEAPFYEILPKIDEKGNPYVEVTKK